MLLTSCKDNAFIVPSYFFLIFMSRKGPERSRLAAAAILASSVLPAGCASSGNDAAWHRGGVKRVSEKWRGEVSATGGGEKLDHTDGRASTFGSADVRAQVLGKIAESPAGNLFLGVVAKGSAEGGRHPDDRVNGDAGTRLEFESKSGPVSQEIGLDAMGGATSWRGTRPHAAGGVDIDEGLLLSRTGSVLHGPFMGGKADIALGADGKVDSSGVEGRLGYRLVSDNHGARLTGLDIYGFARGETSKIPGTDYRSDELRRVLEVGGGVRATLFGRVLLEAQGSAEGWQFRADRSGGGGVEKDDTRGFGASASVGVGF